MAKTHLQWPPNQERSGHSFSTPENPFQGTSENGQISEGIVAFYTPKLEWISPINFYLKVNHSNGINKLV